MADRRLRLAAELQRLATLPDDPHPGVERGRQLARNALQDLAALAPGDDSLAAHRGVLAQYAEALFHGTYGRQAALVDSAFEAGADAVSSLLAELRAPAEMLGSLHADPSKIFGRDTAEAFLFRRGELAYMYMHSLLALAPERPTDRGDAALASPIVVAALLDGIADFTLLTLSSAESYQSKDEKTAELAQQGVRSNNHLLALMYGGEMCMWLLRRASLPPASSRPIAAPPSLDRCVTQPCLSAGLQPFRICSRCRTVAYCSTECQAADWKAGHKYCCGTRPAAELVSLTSSAESLRGRARALLGKYVQAVENNVLLRATWDLAAATRFLAELAQMEQSSSS